MKPRGSAGQGAGVYKPEAIRVIVVFASSQGCLLIVGPQDIAESLNITGLPDLVASALASDVEYRIHQVVEVGAANTSNELGIIVTLTNTRKLLGLCAMLGGQR